MNHLKNLIDMVMWQTFQVGMIPGTNKWKHYREMTTLSSSSEMQNSHSHASNMTIKCPTRSMLASIFLFSLSSDFQFLQPSISLDPQTQLPQFYLNFSHVNGQLQNHHDFSRYAKMISSPMYLFPISAISGDKIIIYKWLSNWVLSIGTSWPTVRNCPSIDGLCHTKVESES